LQANGEAARGRRDRRGLDHWEARMPSQITGLGAALTAFVLCSPASAHDNGQFGDVPEEIRAWFKSVKSPQGIPCCDISDGHRTDYDMRDNHYWVPIDGNWVEVPAEAVLKDLGNPVGDAVVWYTLFHGKAYIRCFVPGGGA
jgi:hypothetical protein